jgi:hypothetical protein
VESEVTTTSEVIMRHTIHPLTRLAVLATTVLGLVLVTAGQAAAMNPPPDPGGPGGGYEGSSTVPIQWVSDSSVSGLQWVLFAAAVLGAFAVGAAVMHLAQHHRRQLAH